MPRQTITSSTRVTETTRFSLESADLDYRTSQLRLVAGSLALCCTLAACGDSDPARPDAVATTTTSNGTAANPTDSGFCEAMAHMIVLLAPTDDSSPDETRATFAEAAGWFEQANTAAPADIADDFAAYKTAYDEYVHFLSTVDFNLDAVFSTPDGEQLAIDTSHTLTPAIVQHVVDRCGLSFGDEQHDPPITTEG